MADFNPLLNKALAVQNATDEGENTAYRVGSLLYAIISAAAETDESLTECQGTANAASAMADHAFTASQQAGAKAENALGAAINALNLVSALGAFVHICPFDAVIDSLPSDPAELEYGKIYFVRETRLFGALSASSGGMGWSTTASPLDEYNAITDNTAVAARTDRVFALGNRICWFDGLGLSCYDDEISRLSDSVRVYPFCGTAATSEAVHSVAEPGKPVFVTSEKCFMFKDDDGETRSCYPPYNDEARAVANANAIFRRGNRLYCFDGEALVRFATMSDIQQAPGDSSSALAALETRVKALEDGGVNSSALAALEARVKALEDGGVVLPSDAELITEDDIQALFGENVT